MEFVYVLVKSSNTWEDMVIILSEEVAVETSIKYPNSRVEVFKKSSLGYVPTYNYYAKGKYLTTQ